VIKTIIAGEALTRALAKQQTWVDRHRALVAELQDTLQQPGPDVASTSTSTPQTRGRRAPNHVAGHALRGDKLRMAKATLRGLGR